MTNKRLRVIAAAGSNCSVVTFLDDNSVVFRFKEGAYYYHYNTKFNTLDVVKLGGGHECPIEGDSTLIGSFPFNYPVKGVSINKLIKGMRAAITAFSLEHVNYGV